MSDEKISSKGLAVKSQRVLITRSNPLKPDPRVRRVARELTKDGFPVAILGWDRYTTEPITEMINGIDIHRLGIRAEFARGIGNLPALIRWEFGLLRWLLANRQTFTTIHACDFDTVLPALLMKLFFRKIVVYDIFDFYAEMLRFTPSWIVKMIRAVDLWAIGQADAVILADDSRREQIKDSDPKRVTVIYNSPRDVFSKLQVEVERSSEGDASLRIAFVGLLHVERGLLELLEVLSRNPEWQLDLAGFGGDEDVILPVAEGLPNVVFHGRISYDKALSLMYRADVLVATYDPRIPNHRYASPNKVFEAMMLAKPIVVARGTNMDRIVERWDCGLIVEYGSVMGLEQVLIRLSADPALRSRLGSASRKAYEQEFNWEIMRQRLLNLYQEL